MARYGQDFKDRAVARLLPPESADVSEVSRDTGVSSSTLERWRAQALAAGRHSGGWTPTARFEAVLATAAMSQEQQSAWCREHGLFPSELAAWRQAAIDAQQRPAGAAPLDAAAARVQRRRIRELERDLRRKERALAEAAALLVLRKKLAAILPADGADD